MIDKRKRYIQKSLSDKKSVWGYENEDEKYRKKKIKERGAKGCGF